LIIKKSITDHNNVIKMKKITEKRGEHSFPTLDVTYLGIKN